MKPFCGYNFADYFDHWLSFGDRLENLPKIFHVNWFRQDDEGRFLWPGFGDNLRVMKWIIDRCEDRIGAVETPIGFLPRPSDIDTTDLNVSEAALNALTSIDDRQWQDEIISIGNYLDGFGERVPTRLVRVLGEVRQALESRAT